MWSVGWYNVGVTIYSFNLSISSKMSYDMLECDFVTELHAYDFVIKYFIIKGVSFVPDHVYE